MRCKNCYRYTAKYCKTPKTCPCCSNEYHINDEANEQCTISKKCINCSTQNIIPDDHTAYDKKCPIFIKEVELQYIKTTYKVDNKTAKQIYTDRHQHGTSLYSQVTKTNNNASTQPQNLYTTTNLSTHPQNSNSTIKATKLVNSPPPSIHRRLIDYSDLTSAPTTSSRKKVIILPRKTSQRIINKTK